MSKVDKINIVVPFPEVVTPEDYEEMYSKALFSVTFDKEKYDRCCDVIDNAINDLLNGEKEVFIEYKDIYSYRNINYGKVKRGLLETRGIELIVTNDFVNMGFRIKLGEKK